MTGILEKIVRAKLIENGERKRKTPVQELEKSEFFNRDCQSLSSALRQNSGPSVIAEFKRKSPSKGIIHDNADVVTITNGYKKAGVAALSVLTDNEFFGGSIHDFTIARKQNSIPILRKDFTVEEYNVIEAKSIGADAVLLIAAVLTKAEIKMLSTLAFSLGLEVLLEIHDENELDKITGDVHIIGVNNRNLKTFAVSLDNSINLADKIPPGFTKVAESGLTGKNDILQLYNAGYTGFLIGELFMKEKDPAMTCKQLITDLKNSLK
ncbi:MAG: indole-3-glycerol phosphate synthase TrpC [Bacteroidota bacterium]